MANLAIYIFGGGIVPDQTVKGGWRSADYNEGDRNGCSWDCLRPIAAHRLYLDNPGSIIIASGGVSNRFGDKAPRIATVLARELVALGVPEGDIVEEGESFNTIAQLLDLQRRILGKRRPYRFVGLSNRYHLPRVIAMILCFPELKPLRCLGFDQMLGAEDILLRHDPEYWRLVVEEAYASAGIVNRLALETKGVWDVFSGLYKPLPPGA